MKTTAEYLDEAKAKLGVESDNKLSERLEISRQAVSQYRNNMRAFDNFTCMQISQVTGIPLETIIADMEIQREPNEKRREAWGNYLKHLGGIAASFMMIGFAFVTLIVTSPDVSAKQSITYEPQKPVIQIMRFPMALKKAPTAPMGFVAQII